MRILHFKYYIKVKISNTDDTYYSLYNNTNFLDKINAKFTKSIGAPQIQNVKWDDIGGLTYVKEEILSALKPSAHNMRRSGNISILLFQ